MDFLLARLNRPLTVLIPHGRWIPSVQQRLRATVANDCDSWTDRGASAEMPEPDALLAIDERDAGPEALQSLIANALGRLASLQRQD